MIPYLGDFAEDATVYIYFNTFDSNDPSASVTITNLADTDIYVHKDGSLTQIATDGATVDIDFDARVGVHEIQIDTSVHADYSTGSDYVVIIEGTTVDGGTITAAVATFSIENRFESITVASISDIKSALVVVDTVADTIASDLILLSTKQDSDMVVVATAHTKTQSDIVIIDDFLDTEMAAQTSNLVIIASDTVAIEALVAGSAIADAVWDETLTGANHNDPSSAGRRLRQIDAAFVVTEGTADAGGASTIDLETGVASTTDDIYNGDRILITAGTGVGEHGLILDYVGSTQQATMSKAWVVTPDATSEYILVPADCDVELWNDNSVTGDGDWAKAQSDLIVIDAAISDVESSLVIVKSDLVVIESDTTVIEAAGGGLTAGQASDLALTEVQNSNIHSRLVVIEASIDSDQVIAVASISDIESSLVIVKSDLVIIISDTTAVESELIIVHSETTIIASDTIVISSDTAVIEAAGGTDPWGVALPGAYTAGEAGFILGHQASLSGGTASSNGTTTTLIDTALTEADDYWNGATIVFHQAGEAGLARTVTNFDAGTDTLTFSPALLTATATSDVYSLIPSNNGVIEVDASGRVDVGKVLGTTQTGGDLAALITTVDTVADTIASDLILLSTKQDSDMVVVATANSDIKSALVVTDAVVDTIYSDTTAIESSSGVIVSGTSDSGSTTTMVDAARTEADTDYWVGDSIVFTSGNISGQTREITAFTPGTDTITFSPATTQAVTTQTYDLITGTPASGLTAAQASDLVAIESELILVHSETTITTSDVIVLSTDVATLSTKQDSDMVVVATANSDIKSELVVASAATAAISTKIDSDAVLVTTANSDIKSALVVTDAVVDTIYSDTTIIASDAVVLTTNLAALSTKQDSDMVVVATATSDIKSALTVVDTVADTIASDLILAQTDLDTLTSDIVVIDAAISDVESSLVIVKSDLVTVNSGIIEGTAATGTLSTTQCTSSLTGYTDDQLIGRIITFTAGPADGESSDITDYASASGLITFTAMTLASENGNAFKIT